MDREARHAAVHRVAKSRTQLNNWTDWEEELPIVEHSDEIAEPHLHAWFIETDMF